MVGAGSAGCVLAARLSQDPGRKILLREARPDYPTRRALPPEIADGTTVAETHDWGSYNEPQSRGDISCQYGRSRSGNIGKCLRLRVHRVAPSSRVVAAIT